MQKNLLILWACEALKVTHRLPTWPKTSRMNKLHKLRQPAQIVSANWIVLNACPRARAPRWMRRTTEAGLRIHHGTLLNLCNFLSSNTCSGTGLIGPMGPSIGPIGPITAITSPLAHRHGSPALVEWHPCHPCHPSCRPCRPCQRDLQTWLRKVRRVTTGSRADGAASGFNQHKRFEPGKLCRVRSSSMPDASIIAIPFLTSQSQVRSFGCTPQGSHVEVTAKLTVGSSSIS